MYSAQILLDSVSAAGVRLTTWELTYPRFIHAELMTHRLFSRNASSSRAIPVSKLMKQVKEDPALPVWWGKNQPGMQANEELDIDGILGARTQWLNARNGALLVADNMQRQGVHKQITNRLLEPWMYITVLVSATTFQNWFHLRDHKDAQPELRVVAAMMREMYDKSLPKYIANGSWHIPLVHEADWVDLRKQYPDVSDENIVCLMKRVSVGRCARVSYLTHDGRRDFAEDIKLHDRLVDSGHWSPFEHVAKSVDRETWNEYALQKCMDSHGLFDAGRVGNFVGWSQYRKEFMKESGVFNDNE